MDQKHDAASEIGIVRFCRRYQKISTGKLLGMRRQNQGKKQHRPR
jgi:hypothetical protein